MPGSMAPLKKPRNAATVPLALNPLKSKDVLAVLAERNQAIMPVGAWVEPALPDSSEVPAYTSAYMIEEELKEQLRKKQEALKHFQRQVKRRVNQQIRLRKKQQFQRSYEAAEKEGSIAMQSSDTAHLTPKRTSVFPDNLNAAIGSAGLPPSQMLGDGMDDRENQNELFQQQAQALSQTMKQARHRLASFKTVNKKNASVFPDSRRKTSPSQEKALCRKPSSLKINTGTRRQLTFQEHDSEESSSITTDKETENLFWEDQHSLLSEDRDKSSSRVQETGLKQPASILIGPRGREAFPLDVHQDLPPRHQDQTSTRDKKVRFKESYSDVSSEKGREDYSLAGYQYLPPKLQDQTFIRDQNMFVKQLPSFMRAERVSDELPLEYRQYVEPKTRDRASPREQSKYIKQPSSYEKWEIERRIPSGAPSHRNYGQALHNVTDERWRKELLPERHKYVFHDIQDPGSAREQSLYFRRQPSVGTAERWREDLLLDDHQHLPAKHQRGASSKRQVYDDYQSRSNTEFQIPLTLQSGVDQEEDKRERQKQYLRYRRLFMDIEREQVKEQQRQKEHQKKVEKIKKKKEQQRYAEEQRILRMNFHEELCSGEKMSDILAQLKLEELKGVREKQQQREKESQRYIEALRAQIQEKMRLYNITLPPLCCCGPDFWDAHPDTCANNCIFYKNHRAYTRALHSVINSCDIPEGTSTVRVAMHNLASAHRRTLKNL
ncbi:coiled-coil domain-containing protein 15 isoform X11 [Meles meles]|uniref:coiled-coil domain-containing protein 15 isoform X11 n=1 Tax=Meles meles TaxID=9662 RepID=UPI001E6A091F|nr:coiled-coil domain-containing protein 15 isoform X11 [Meles meles]